MIGITSGLNARGGVIASELNSAHFEFIETDIEVPTTVVEWPSRRAKHAQVWRVLDLSGLSQNPRQSEGMVKAGWVFKNGSPVRSERATVPVGSTFTLEVRFPSGRITSKQIKLIEQGFSPRVFARQTGPTILHRKG